MCPENSYALMSFFTGDTLKLVPHVMLSSVLEKTMLKLGLSPFRLLSKSCRALKHVLRLEGVGFVSTCCETDSCSPGDAKWYLTTMPWKIH